VLPEKGYEIIGIRPGEKLHEQMISAEDSPYTYEYETYYKILPAIYSWYIDQKRIMDGKKVIEGFTYSSDKNKSWMTIETLQKWIEQNTDKIGKI